MLLESPLIIGFSVAKLIFSTVAFNTAATSSRPPLFFARMELVQYNPVLKLSNERFGSSNELSMLAEQK